MLKKYQKKLKILNTKILKNIKHQNIKNIILQLNLNLLIDNKNFVDS